jgi:hypothetical protein
MTRRDKIYYLLSLVKEKADELLSDEEFVKDDFTPEELLAACVGLVLNKSIPAIKYTSPVARVDRSNITFIIDKNVQINISPYTEDELYEDED